MDGLLDDNDALLEEYRAPLAAFKDLVSNRQAIEDTLIRNYQQLVAEYAEKCEELQMEKQQCKMWQRESMSRDKEMKMMRRELMGIKNSNTANSFVFAILDGDGALFLDDFVRKGAEGGEEAAHLLKNEITNYINEIDPEFNAANIIVQIVLNVEGLSSALHASGTIRSPDLIGFTRGFSRVQPLFSIVDVGAGKESTDNKVRKLFEVMEADAQCKHIIFGPCHDNGYVRLLETYEGKASTREKLTLLEATPPAAEFKKLTFQRTRFPKVFRTEMIPSKPITSFGRVTPPAPPGFSPTVRSANIVNGGGPTNAPASQAAGILLHPTPAPVGGSWATVSQNNAVKSFDLRPRKTADTRAFLLLNKDDERVDPKIPDYDSTLYYKIQNDAKTLGNLCNRHYLKGDCPDGDNCKYRHGPALNGPELLVIKHMTRNLPCPSLTQCRDVHCTLGHHCKNPKACTFSSKCRFHDLHGMSITPTLKIYDDGEREVVG